ncbi:hypothetical protein OSTOST_19922 [Ostertagia ostertagi]
MSAKLKCKDIIIGKANGSSFNFVNTLRCPLESKWCINMNVSFHSPIYSIEGLFGNCDSSGFIGALLNFTKPMADLSCKASHIFYFIFFRIRVIFESE